MSIQSTSVDRSFRNNKTNHSIRDIEQYDFDEIGKILDMKPATVRVSLSRARKTIKEQLIKEHSYGIS